METVRLSSHSEMLFGSVCRASSPVPLTESVYHLFNFFLARGGERGELCLPECQSGAAYNTVPHRVEELPALLPRLQFLKGDGVVGVVWAASLLLALRGPRLSPALWSAQLPQIKTVPPLGAPLPIQASPDVC